jgi:hypothetical protein
MKTKHEMREAAIKRLRGVISNQSFVMTLCSDDITKPLVGDGWSDSTVEEDAKTIIDLLTDDEPPYEGDAFAMGPRDADGILWFRGDMSDSEWGVIEKPHFDGDKWMVRGHDLTAPWIPADSIRHAPMRTATQQEDVCRCRNCIATKRNNDLIELLKDAADEYQTLRFTYNELTRMYDLMRARMENDMVDLPVDATGALIHIGDRVVEHEDGHDFTVDGYEYDGEWWVFHRDGIRASADMCAHYKVEDVLNELVEKVYENAWNDGEAGVRYDMYAYEKLIKEYSEKLRLKED